MIIVSLFQCLKLYLRLISLTQKNRTIMTVNFQYVNIDVSETLSQFTTEKLEKLNEKFEFLISAQVYFKHDEKDHEAGKICNIELSLPGPRIFAKSNEREYELAVTETVNDLRRQLEKRKETYKVY